VVADPRVGAVGQLDQLGQPSTLVVVALGDAVAIERREHADVGVELEHRRAELAIAPTPAGAQARRDAVGDRAVGIGRELEPELVDLEPRAGRAVVAGWTRRMVLVESQ
jgi:hypothetical protein